MLQRRFRERFVAYCGRCRKCPGYEWSVPPFDGYGVVALKAFAEGEKIADIEGVTWRDGEDVDDRYSLWVEDGLYYDMVDQTRFINHSCEPNAWVDVGITDDGEVWAMLIALRPIAIGEELSYDYAFPPDLAEPCRCK